MTKHKKSKMSLSDICKNILMVCGVITALTGVAGGVLDTIDKYNKSHSEPVMIDSGDSGGNGNSGDTDTMEVKGRSPASVDEPGGDMGYEDIPTEPVSMSVAPENDLSGGLKGLWMWFLGIGIVVMGGIIGIGKVVKRSIDENTGSGR